ncbi:MAG TPA: hypothetical protein VF002_02885 [Gaiellaceae bacterium]
MATGLGLLGLLGFILAVIVLAASVTWIVVKVTPQRRKPEQPAP